MLRARAADSRPSRLTRGLVAAAAALAVGCSGPIDADQRSPLATTNQPSALETETAGTSSGQLACRYDGSVPRGAPSIFTAVGPPGMVTECTVRATGPPGPADIVVELPRSDTLEISWTEGACADRAAIELAPTDGELHVTVRVWQRPFECPAIGYPYSATLRVARALDAGTVIVTDRLAVDAPTAISSTLPTHRGSSTDTDAVPLDPPRPPAAPPSCDGAYSLLEWVEPPSVRSLARRASSIIVATVVGVGSGQWNTEDGQPPRDPDDIDPYLDVMTLARLRVDAVLSGQPGRIATVWLPGGTIGCATYSVSDYPRDVKAGQRFVVAMGDLTPRTGVEGVVRAEAMWPVDEHGLVSTRYDGALSIAALVERAEQALTP